MIPTSNNYKINKDMNKQLVQKIVEVYNDNRNDNMIHILIEVDNMIYNCYDDIKYGDKGIAFIDEDGKPVLLAYKYVVGIKVRNI